MVNFAQLSEEPLLGLLRAGGFVRDLEQTSRRACIAFNCVGTKPRAGQEPGMSSGK